MDTAELPDEPTIPAAFERRLPLLVSKLGDEILIQALPRLERLGLDGRAYTTLAVLAEDRPRSQLELSKIIGKVPGLVVSVIDELEAAGLVERRRSPEDRRRTIVEVTELGRARLAQADAISEQLEAELFAALSPEEMAAFHDALRRVMRQVWQPC